MPPRTPEDWNNRYLSGEPLPWDSGLPSAELQRVIQERHFDFTSCIELGCGTGTSCLWLAQQGVDVVGIDCSAEAVNLAREKLHEASQAARALFPARFVHGDLCQFEEDLEPADFLFDRGCYHCLRKSCFSGYLKTVRTLLKPAGFMLILAGNINEQNDTGIPKVRATVLCSELESDFHLVQLRAFHFEDVGGTAGPLGWSCLLQRHQQEP